jgi:Tfp pilus assembly protein PilN
MPCLPDAPHYMLEGPVGLAGLPPKVRDDKFTGGVICGAALLLTVLALGGMWGGKAWQKHSIEQLKVQIQMLEQAQSSAQSTLDNMDNQIKRSKKLYASLSSMPPKVTRSYTEILLALSETLPQYSRIESVVQEKDRTRITGTTLWSQEVSGFSVALQEALVDTQLRVVPMTMTPGEKAGETLFEMEVR